MMLTRNLMLNVLLMSIVGCSQPGDDLNSTEEQSEAESTSDDDQAVSETESRNDWADEYAKMESTLNRSASEASSLKAACEARGAEVSSWMAAWGSALEGLKKHVGRGQCS